MPQKMDSTKHKQSAEGERGHGTKDTRSKRNRTDEPSKDKHSDQGNEEQKTQTKSGENDHGQDKGKEPTKRDSSIKTSASRTPSWHREGFRLPMTQTELINLAMEINKSAPTLTDPRVGWFLGDGFFERCIDFDTLKSISSTSVNDTLGLLGSHLAQVSNARNGFILMV